MKGKSELMKRAPKEVLHEEKSPPKKRTKDKDADVQSSVIICLF